LRRYDGDGTFIDVALSGAPEGIGPGALPRYLLIYGTPQQVPWDLQYRLNTSCAVGRLDLSGEPLNNYVDALIANWPNSQSQTDHPVVWAVDHGDIMTPLMREVIAKPIVSRLRADKQIGDKVCYLAGSAATADALVEALRTDRPALVVTTSHGVI